MTKLAENALLKEAEIQLLDQNFGPKVLRRGFNWRLFWRRLTWSFWEYLIHVSSNAKFLHLKQ